MNRIVVRSQKGLSLIMVLLLVVLPLAGCAPVQPASAPQKPQETLAAKPAGTPMPTTKPATDQPRYGGVLTVTHEADPVSMDLQQETPFTVTAAIQSAYNGLVQFDQASEKIVGDLAQSWDISPDGKVVTFHIQPGAKWHDGKPVTAEDIKFSLIRTVNPPKGIKAPRSEELSMMDTVETLDQNTAKATLKYPSSYFIPALAIPLMVMYSKSSVEAKGDMKKDVMGSGPFKLKRYDPGISIEMVKNSDYFVKGRPYLDGIIFYIIRDRGTRAAAFRTGQVKLTGPGVAGIYPAEIKAVEASMPNVVLTRYGGLAWANATINSSKPPFNDVRVRQAMSLATNRQQGLQALYLGEGRMGAYIPGKFGIAPEDLQKAPGYRQPKDADLAEAKRLMAEAGYPNGFKISVLEERGYENIGEFMLNQLTQIGIQGSIDVKEGSVRTAMLTKGDFDIEGRTQVFHLADPSNTARYFKSVTGDDPKQNFGRLNDAKVDELYDKQERAQDPAERLKLSRELDSRLVELVPRIVICYYDYILGAWPEVKDRVLKIGFYPEFKYQDVWLAK